MLLSLAPSLLPTQHFRLVNVSEYHTFTPTITNEFRVGFNRFDENISSAATSNFPGLDQFPNITLFDLGTGLNIGPDGNAPQFTVQNFYQFVDNISWVKGKHNLKFGGEYRWYISPQQFTQRRAAITSTTPPRFIWRTLRRTFSGSAAPGLAPITATRKRIYWYANDTWRMNQHLTLNLGVRYEYTTTPTGENRQTLNAISNTPSLLVPQDGNQPLVFSNAAGSQEQLGATRRYSPTHREASGDTSIRAGFGLA